MRRTVCSLAVAAGCAGALASVYSSAGHAQDNAAAPPIWKQGMPETLGESRLAPHANKLTATPPDQIKLDRLAVPQGFKVELWASGLPGGRAMALSEDGRKVWIGTRALGRVYEVSDVDGKRTVRTIADKLNQPSGVAYKDGALYVFAIDKVLKFDAIASNPDVRPQDLTSKFELPPLQHHNWKYVAFGPDGKLYVPFGAPCNICEPAKEYAQIRRYNADGSGMEVVATGVRNSVGFDWHPKTGELWFSDHGRDWMGDDTPSDELNRLSRPGQSFGFPYCHADGVIDADFKKQDACKEVALPVLLMGPHAAVMGVKFYTGTMFPQEYRDQMFVVRKGSWNRNQPSGFDIVTVKADAEGKSAQMTPFMTGFNASTDRYDFWGRPAYVQQMPDGALLVSDEQAGAIYRISYQKPAGAN